MARVDKALVEVEGEEMGYGAGDRRQWCWGLEATRGRLQAWLGGDGCTRRQRSEKKE